ncbi:unnamed protein product [Toxocara canis]|uniref:E2F transcription factor 6 n=1 Tax=Toxocara canis TaxID=6265 RepID=A0A183VH15_TOXCA|nr:unnamed protein product [Toxocara canis]
MFLFVKVFRLTTHRFQAYDIQPLEDFPETILDFEGEDAEDYLENGEPHVNGIMTETPEPESTCRIKLLRPELPPDMQPESTADLKCAVNVKERIEINGIFRYCSHNVKSLKQASRL